MRCCVPLAAPTGRWWPAPRCSTCIRATACLPGKKSLAIEVVFQPRERTLTDADIEAASEKVVAAVSKATGATLR